MDVAKVGTGGETEADVLADDPVQHGLHVVNERIQIEEFVRGDLPAAERQQLAG